MVYWIEKQNITLSRRLSILQDALNAYIRWSLTQYSSCCHLKEPNSDVVYYKMTSRKVTLQNLKSAFLMALDCPLLLHYTLR
jgi:hypothetical protein